MERRETEGEREERGELLVPDAWAVLLLQQWPETGLALLGWKEVLPRTGQVRPWESFRAMRLQLSSHSGLSG